MASESLPPIPTPPAQRWREFRIQVLPVVTFVTVVAMLAVMWRSFVQPSGLIGEVQAIRANIVSLQDGVFAELNVGLFEEVKADQPIGRVLIQSEDAQRAALTAAEADLRVLNQRMNLDRTRNLDSYTQLKLRLAEENIALALAKLDAKYANEDYDRVEKLHKVGLVPDASPDANQVTMATATRDREKFAQAVEVRTKAVQELEKDVEEMKKNGKITVEALDPAVDEAIKAQKRVIELTEGPQVLRAPINGRVSAIFKRAGEKVVRGEPLLTISAPTSDRVLGYLRQPINTVPTTNDTVKVRTRSQKRLVAECKILHVGPSLEPINPALISPDVQRVEHGLPILVALPSDFRLVPGEFVDLSIQYSKR